MGPAGSLDETAAEMRRRVVTVLAIVGFFAGLLAAPAMATSYNTGWHSFFGHSTSCALALGSINDSTRKSGGQTINRKGCHSGNAAVAVPKDWLGVITHLYRPATGYQCSPDVYKRNSSSSAGITATSALAVSSYCPAGGSYTGTSAHVRVKSAGGQASTSLSTVIRPF